MLHYPPSIPPSLPHTHLFFTLLFSASHAFLAASTPPSLPPSRRRDASMAGGRME